LSPDVIAVSLDGQARRRSHWCNPPRCRCKGRLLPYLREASRLCLSQRSV